VRHERGNFSLTSFQVGRVSIVLTTEGWELADSFEEAIKRVELISHWEEPGPVFFVKELLHQLHICLIHVVRYIAVYRHRGVDSSVCFVSSTEWHTILDTNARI